VAESNTRDDPLQPHAASAGERRPEDPPGKELDDLTRGASRLLGLSAFTVSIVAGEEPHPKGETVLSKMAEQVRRGLLYTLCLGVVDGEPLIVEDTSQVEKSRDVKAFEAAGVGCCLCFPLRANGWQVIGLLCLLGESPRAWRKAELSLVNDLAQLAAIEMRREAGLETFSGNDLHLRTRRAVMNGLLGGGGSEQAIRELLGGLCRNLQWDAGSVWFSSSARAAGLECVGRWSRSEIGFDAFAALYESLNYDVKDMLGQVWMRQEPIWTSDLSALTDVRRAALAQQAGFNAGLWFPIINNGNALGVIELLANQPHPEHDRLLLFALSLGRQIGDLVGLTAPQILERGGPY
jgi:GAF domain-containing protein